MDAYKKREKRLLAFTEFIAVMNRRAASLTSWNEFNSTRIRRSHSTRVDLNRLALTQPNPIRSYQTRLGWIEHLASIPLTSEWKAASSSSSSGTEFKFKLGFLSRPCCNSHRRAQATALLPLFSHSFPTRFPTRFPYFSSIVAPFALLSRLAGGSRALSRSLACRFGSNVRHWDHSTFKTESKLQQSSLRSLPPPPLVRHSPSIAVV